MKRIIIVILIATEIIAFSVRKPIKNTQSKSVVIKQSNIGLPKEAVKELNKLISP